VAVSIAKRIWDLTRANLTDFRSELFARDDDFPVDDELDGGAHDSKTTIGAKAGRRARRIRDAAEDAWDRAYEAAQARAQARGATADHDTQRLRWYRTLELEPGADLVAVRKAYRRLLKIYHPDRHANDPEKYRAATEVTRKLTEAYDGLTGLQP